MTTEPREAPVMSELRRLLDAATPGPWVVQHDDDEGVRWIDSHFYSDGPVPVVTYPINGDGVGEPDAALIVYLRNNAEALLRVVEAADAVQDFLRGTTVMWEGGSVPADQASIVRDLRAALERATE